MASASDAMVQELLNGRYIATLATENPDGSIHMVAVWYLFEDGCLYVSTASDSKKARNVAERSKASLMIDARDPQASRGVTAMGTAELLRGEEAARCTEKVNRRYLSAAALADVRVGPVFQQWGDAAIRLRPARYVAWDMREADRQVFGGAMAANPGYLLPVER
jgi:PPOX class probable F420-dependent enzyme